MHNYIELDSVMNYITPAVRKEDSKMNLLSNARQAYHSLKINKRFVTNMESYQICNHKVDLPDGIRYIDLVVYLSDYDPNKEVDILCKTDSTCSSCSTEISCGTPGIYFADANAYCGECDGCITEPENFLTRTNNICRHTINYQLYIDSQFFNECFTPMRYVGQTNGLMVKNNINLYATCEAHFSLDPSEKQLISSIKDGYLCIVYRGDMKKNGKFLIPDDEDLKRGLSYYAMAMHWLNRSDMHEEMAWQKYQTLLVQAENILNKWRGSTLLENIDIDLISAINGVDSYTQRMLRAGKLNTSYFR